MKAFLTIETKGWAKRVVAVDAIECISQKAARGGPIFVYLSQEAWETQFTTVEECLAAIRAAELAAQEGDR